MTRYAMGGECIAPCPNVKGKGAGATEFIGR